MTSITDQHPDYWEEYTNLQYVKHNLLRRYLGGWFPKLSKWRGRVLYVDCHAGRGLHATGQQGSPLIALDTLITHRALPSIIANSEVRFLFIEADEDNKKELEARLALLSLPEKIHVDVICDEYEEVIQALVNYLTENNLEMAPAFVFVDPYGFTLSMKLLSQLQAFDRCELFVNFMWRFVDMAIANPALEESMNSLFGSEDWKKLREIEDVNERCEAAINLFQQGLGARYVSWIRMLGDNQVTKYVLIHATNHQDGRSLMKDAIWNIAPTGGFLARINDNPNQEYLIKPEPNLRPLEVWLWQKYRGHSVRYQEIERELLHIMFLPKHLHEIIRELRNNKKINCSEYGRKFSFRANPLIEFPVEIEPSN